MELQKKQIRRRIEGDKSILAHYDNDCVNFRLHGNWIAFTNMKWVIMGY